MLHTQRAAAGRPGTATAPEARTWQLCRLLLDAARNVQLILRAVMAGPQTHRDLRQLDTLLLWPLGMRTTGTPAGAGVSVRVRQVAECRRHSSVCPDTGCTLRDSGGLPVIHRHHIEHCRKCTSSFLPGH